MSDRLPSETDPDPAGLQFLDPALFEGLVIRRVLAYLLDVLLIAVLGVVATGRCSGWSASSRSAC